MQETIATKRLLLRPLRESDLAALAAALNSRRISHNTARIPWPYSLDDARAHLARVSRGERGTLNMMIVEKQRADRVVGGIGYEADGAGHGAELGYWLAETLWSKGYGHEAAKAVVDHAFKVSRHDRLHAGYRHGNEASRRILDRLGFRIVGHSMMPSLGAGHPTPVARLELTRREWLKAKDRAS
jgi:RimJ/RimL family protein N-acetyltransferase